MRLKEFIEKFVCKNSLIKLWCKYEYGHRQLAFDRKEVFMEWEILKDEKGQFSKNWEVVGVIDIVCTDDYREAINIVIKF